MQGRGVPLPRTNSGETHGASRGWTEACHVLEASETVQKTAKECEIRSDQCAQPSLRKLIGIGRERDCEHAAEADKAVADNAAANQAADDTAEENERGLPARGRLEGACGIDMIQPMVVRARADRKGHNICLEPLTATPLPVGVHTRTSGGNDFLPYSGCGPPEKGTRSSTSPGVRIGARPRRGQLGQGTERPLFVWPRLC